MYSFALQLDRNNASLREKFDRMVGQPSGPTFTGHAAQSRRSRSGRGAAPVSAEQKKLAATLGIINGIGGALVASMLAVVASTDSALPRRVAYLDWPP